MGQIAVRGEAVAETCRAADYGLRPAFHRSIRPIKRKGGKSQLLLHDHAGRQTTDKSDEAMAIKQCLAIRGRGELMAFSELVERARVRSRDFDYELECEAVVGIVDTRRRAAVCHADKAHGPGGLPSKPFRAAPSEMTRLTDPVAVEDTLTGEVPLGWQGGDNTMLLKSAIKGLQCLTNQRSILLADCNPKIVGGEIRGRMSVALAPHISSTQWGDGFGARSCELAHLGMEACSAVAYANSQSLIRLFIDVVQAFPSIVASLSIPLPSRDVATATLLTDLGFSLADVDDIVRSGVGAAEWASTSSHMKRVLAAFQEDQWVAQDFSGGVMAASVGCSAGVPLAGVIAVVALSGITRRIHVALEALGIGIHLSTAEAHSDLDPGSLLVSEPAPRVTNFGIVDDDVYVHACTAAEVPERLQTIASTVFNEYRRAGLELH